MCHMAAQSEAAGWSGSDIPSACVRFGVSMIIISAILAGSDDETMMMLLFVDDDDDAIKYELINALDCTKMGARAGGFSRP